MVYIDERYLEDLFGVQQDGRVSASSRSSVPSLPPSSEGRGPSDAVPLSEEAAHEAFKKIGRLVKVRDRSVAEVRGRLAKDGFSEAVIDQAVGRALRCSYLDDRRFADVLVRSRLNAGKGLAGIVRELKDHGIDPESQLPDFPDAYLSTDASQHDAALALLRRKPPRAKNRLQAAYAKLVRAGYTSQVASEVARQWYRECCSNPMR